LKNILNICAALGTILLLWGCNGFSGKKMDERITLRKGDKIPYGTYVAYENLQYMFPVADIKVSQESPAAYSSFISDYTYNSSSKHSKALYVIITP
jgi:hypothetical protein